jgi:hypothetical protein
MSAAKDALDTEKWNLEDKKIERDAIRTMYNDKLNQAIDNRQWWQETVADQQAVVDALKKAKEEGSEDPDIDRLILEAETELAQDKLRLEEALAREAALLAPASQIELTEAERAVQEADDKVRNAEDAYSDAQTAEAAAAAKVEAIQAVIDEIKRTCRWCVVVAHGGEEFTALPSPYTRDRYLQYLEMGADVVLSHHPHVPMNYETVGDKLIFYSLGNFIFDTDYQRAQYNTEYGIVVKLLFTTQSVSFEARGLKIDRETERVVPWDLPRIFRDVHEKDYRLLVPLSEKLLVQATKRQMTFLFPERFRGATEEDWAAHFAEPLRTGRVPGEVLDFYIICPLAAEAENGAWRESDLEDVKNYILDQLE